MKPLKFITVPEIEISFNKHPSKLIGPKILSTKDSAKLFINQWGSDLATVEEFKVMYLNHTNRVKGIHTLARGGIAAVCVDVRVIYAIALKILATSIIVAHNHPSGNLEPSNHDRLCTNDIVKCGEILKIPLIDHLIITPNLDYLSFADRDYI